MRKIIITIVAIICLAARSEAQQMNFQGKLYLSSAPYSGTGTIKFLLPDFPAWSDTEHVVVNNGLYATVMGNTTPIPMNLFDSGHNSRKLYVFFNTNPIDTLTLFAPFERDPNISRYIRDSIFWNNVHSKPTLDTSFTNEIQYLSINGDTLKLQSASGLGNYVILTNLRDTLGTTTVNGNFTVIDSTLTTMLTVPATGGTWTTLPIAPLTGVWQSFKAMANGKLRYIRVNMLSTISSVIFTFYNGQGTGTSLISPTALTCPTSFGTAVFDVSSFNLGLVSGNTYTFCFVPNVGGQITAQIQSDVYSGGIEGTFVPVTSSTTSNPGNDLSFSIDIDNTNPSCLTFGTNCYVGIGTNTPTSQLDVKGRVKDLTGFLTPVGTVVSYAGRNIPQGWLLCDGRAISRVTYSDLYEAIDTSWGHGDGATTFNLPDLRGRFLRGLDTSSIVGASGIDVDRGTRTAAGGTNGGNTGNNVGAMQSESVIAHNHNSFTDPISGVTFDGLYLAADGNTTTSYTNANIGYEKFGTSMYNCEVLFNSSLGNYGGHETRPVNSVVYYIIKY